MKQRCCKTDTLDRSDANGLVAVMRGHALLRCYDSSARDQSLSLLDHLLLFQVQGGSDSRKMIIVSICCMQSKNGIYDIAENVYLTYGRGEIDCRVDLQYLSQFVPQLTTITAHNISTMTFLSKPHISTCLAHRTLLLITKTAAPLFFCLSKCLEIVLSFCFQVLTI